MAIPQFVQCSLAHENWFANANSAHQGKTEFSTAWTAYGVYRSALRAADNNCQTDSSLVTEYVRVLNEYKDEIDLLKYKVAFKAQSKFHSTVMEEFWGLLFGEQLNRIITNSPPTTQIFFLGNGEALQNILFAPHSLVALFGQQQQNDPWFHIRTKDRDFMIARKANISITVDGSEVHQYRGQSTYSPVSEMTSLLPLVTIECKQYADKTMLDNAMAAADHRRQTAPHCLDLIAVELNKLIDWNIGGSGLDNFYLLRKQKLSDAKFRPGTGPEDTVDVARRNQIDADVVLKIYERVKAHLNAQYWRASETELLANGFVLGG